MIRSVVAVIMIFGLMGCSVPSVAPAVERVGSTQASPTPQPMRIGDLAVRSLSVADLKTFGPEDYQGYFLRIKPAFHSPDSLAPKLTSGNYNFEYRFPPPPEFGETSVLSAVRVADLPVLQAGMEASYVEQTIRPVVRDWAVDGVLYTAYVSLPPRFGNSPPRPTMDTEADILKVKGWPLAYLSKSRREVLFFFPSGLVVLTRWQPRDLDETTVKVPKQEAIARYVAAIRDPAFKSDEERTGQDYFLGVPYAGAFPPPEQNVHDDLVPAYEVPDTVKWDARFDYQFAGKPVWLVLGAEGGGLGLGWVDAQTGTIIRFQRPRQGYIVGPFIPAPAIL